MSWMGGAWQVGRAAKEYLVGQREVYRAAVRAWKGKAIKVTVEDSRGFFDRKRLRKSNDDLLLKAFRVEHVSSGALLTRRKILLPPEYCAERLGREMPGARFEVVSLS